MNIIQKLRNLIFGKSEVVEAPAPVVVEAPVVEKSTKEEVKELVKHQEAKPKTKRKYNRKKKSNSETK